MNTLIEHPHICRNKEDCMICIEFLKDCTKAVVKRQTRMKMQVVTVMEVAVVVVKTDSSWPFSILKTKEDISA